MPTEARSANRIRFPVEVLEAMAGVDGADRVGLRICPGNPFNDLTDDDPAETFGALLAAVDPLGARLPARDPASR